MDTDVAGMLAALFHPGARPDPYPLLGRLRTLSPYVEPPLRLAVLGRFTDAAAALRDRGLSSLRPGSPSFFSLDPPRHTRLRALAARAFTPDLVASVEPSIHRVTRRVLATAAERGGLDIAQDLGYPLTAAVLAELFGVPVAEVVLWDGWTRLLTLAIDPRPVPDPAFTERVERARAEFEEYLRPLVRRRRGSGGGDLISRLADATDGGNHLDEQELLDTCVLFAVAARENPVGMIGNTVLALLRHPDQWRRLRQDPTRADAVVAEALRYDPPAQLTGRTTTVEVELGGVRVPPGYGVLILLAAANRDPDRFPDADRFDPDRRAGAHLAFAAGPHYCMGADLAVLQTRVAVRMLTEAIARPEWDPASLVYKPNVSIRGVEQLRVSAAVTPLPASGR